MPWKGFEGCKIVLSNECVFRSFRSTALQGFVIVLRERREPTVGSEVGRGGRGQQLLILTSVTRQLREHGFWTARTKFLPLDLFLQKGGAGGKKERAEKEKKEDEKKLEAKLLSVPHRSVTFLQLHVQSICWSCDETVMRACRRSLSFPFPFSHR
jgi:hypothetical protein